MNKEIWKPIEGYEGLYEVSNYGRIKSIIGFNGHEYVKRNKILKNSRQNAKSSYYRSVVNLCKNKKAKTYKVHRLVARAFIPNPNNYPEVNHIDGNPLNNRVENLEWCTTKHNIHHAIDNGLQVYSINTINRETMVELLNNGYTYDEISNFLGIAKGTVFNYIKRFNIKKVYV